MNWKIFASVFFLSGVLCSDGLLGSEKPQKEFFPKGFCRMVVDKSDIQDRSVLKFTTGERRGVLKAFVSVVDYIEGNGFKEKAWHFLTDGSLQRIIKKCEDPRCSKVTIRETEHFQIPCTYSYAEKEDQIKKSALKSGVVNVPVSLLKSLLPLKIENYQDGASDDEDDLLSGAEFSRETNYRASVLSGFASYSDGWAYFSEKNEDQGMAVLVTSQATIPLYFLCDRYLSSLKTGQFIEVKVGKENLFFQFAASKEVWEQKKLDNVSSDTQELVNAGKCSSCHDVMDIFKDTKVPLLFANIKTGVAESPVLAFVNKWENNYQFAEIGFELSEDGKEYSILQVYFPEKFTRIAEDGLIEVKGAGEKGVFQIVSKEAFCKKWEMEQQQKTRPERPGLFGTLTKKQSSKDNKELQEIANKLKAELAAKKPQQEIDKAPESDSIPKVEGFVVAVQASTTEEGKAIAERLVGQALQKQAEEAKVRQSANAGQQKSSYLLPAAAGATIATLLLGLLLYVQKANIAGFDVAHIVDSLLAKYNFV